MCKIPVLFVLTFLHRFSTYQIQSHSIAADGSSLKPVCLTLIFMLAELTHDFTSGLQGHSGS